MCISFNRGCDHEVKFKFKSYTGSIEKMWLTVKCKAKRKRLQKKLGDGIELVDGYYVVTFVPEDTYEIPCDLEMTYSIKIVTNGKKFIVKKDTFELIDGGTNKEDEV